MVAGLSALITSLRLVPASLVVGTLNITFPLVPVLDKTLDKINPYADSISTALLAIVIVRIIAAAIALVGSVFGAINNNIRLHVVLNTLSFATVANISLLVGAAVVTIDLVATAVSIRSIGMAVGLDIKFGTQFIAIEWVAAVSSLVGTFYWASVWFVEFRQISFSRRPRRSQDVGDWYGIWSELKKDWRGTAQQPINGFSDEEVLVDRAGLSGEEGQRNI